MHRPLAVAMLALVAVACGTGRAETARQCSAPSGIASGFTTDLCRHLVPLTQFQSGGPGKDGIPALDHPRFSPTASVDWLASREPVIALAVGRDVRAYPLQILIWHPPASHVRTARIPTPATTTPQARRSSRRHTRATTGCRRRSASSSSNAAATRPSSPSRFSNADAYSVSRSAAMS